MKRVLLLLMIATAFVACSKDEEALTHSKVFFNIYNDGSLIDKGSVYALIFEDNGKEIDTEASIWNEDGKVSVPFMDGTRISPLRSSSGSVNTFEALPVGKYIIMAYYAPYAYPYYSYKKVEFSIEIETFSMNFVADEYGYVEWSEE